MTRFVQLFSRLRRWGAAHPVLYYLAPLALWILFVAWASLTAPGNLPTFEFDLADKLEHTVCYALLAVLLLRGWLRGGAVTLGACLIIGMTAVAWGIYLEFLQRAIGYRTFDLWDAAANSIGAVLGLAAWAAIKRK